MRDAARPSAACPAVHALPDGAQWLQSGDGGEADEQWRASDGGERRRMPLSAELMHTHVCVEQQRGVQERAVFASLLLAARCSLLAISKLLLLLLLLLLLSACISCCSLLAAACVPPSFRLPVDWTGLEERNCALSCSAGE